MGTVEILAICLVVAVIAVIILSVRVVVLRNNLYLFGERLKEIQQKLSPKQKQEVQNEQKNG